MKKRIVHCIDRLQGGGAQTQLIHLCNYTDKKKFEVIILCFDATSVLKVNPDVKIVTIKKQKGIKIFYSWYYIFNKIIALKPDILQLWLPDIVTIPSVISGMFCKNCFIISCSRRVPIKKISTLWFRDRLKYIAHFFADILTVNYPMPLKRQSVFNKIYKKNKGIIIFNGIDIKFLSEYNRHNIYKGGTFNLVYAGRLTYQKNINLLILAIKQLRKAGYSIKLDIFGKGEDKDEDLLYELVSKNELNDVITFHGFKQDWYKLVGNAHAFILPSSLEGMPNVLFESIVLGIPVIATNIEEITYHFTNNYDAVLFDPGSIESIIITIEKIIKNSDLLQKIYCNSCITIQKYSIISMVNQYENLYNTVN